MTARVTAIEQAIVRIDAVLPTLATKSDVAETVGELKAEIQRGINETQRWTIATIIGLFVGFGGLFMAMSNALKPTPAAAAPQVIVVPTPATKASGP